MVPQCTGPQGWNQRGKTDHRNRWEMMQILEPAGKNFSITVVKMLKKIDIKCHKTWKTGDNYHRMEIHKDESSRDSRTQKTLTAMKNLLDGCWVDFQWDVLGNLESGQQNVPELRHHGKESWKRESSREKSGMLWSSKRFAVGAPEWEDRVNGKKWCSMSNEEAFSEAGQGFTKAEVAGICKAESSQEGVSQRKSCRHVLQGPLGSLPEHARCVGWDFVRLTRNVGTGVRAPTSQTKRLRSHSLLSWRTQND